MLECGAALGTWRWVSAFCVWVQRCSLGRGHGGSRNTKTTPVTSRSVVGPVSV